MGHHDDDRQPSPRRAINAVGHRLTDTRQPKETTMPSHFRQGCCCELPQLLLASRSHRSTPSLHAAMLSAQPAVNGKRIGHHRSVYQPSRVAWPSAAPTSNSGLELYRCLFAARSARPFASRKRFRTPPFAPRTMTRTNAERSSKGKWISPGGHRHEPGNEEMKPSRPET